MNIRPLNKDIIIKRVDDPQITPTSIFLLGKRETEYSVAWFEVTAIGPDVTLCAIGDTILIKYGEFIQPFIVDGEVFTMTDETKVHAVVR